MNVILMTIGGLIFLNGIFVCLFTNFNLGTVLTLMAGVLLFSCGFRFKQIQDLTKFGVLKAVKYAVLIVVLAEALLIVHIGIFGMTDNADNTEDAIIVLGAAVHGDKVSIPLKMRLDKTVEYSKKNPHAYIVVSGGRGMQESVTEAYAMKKYLIENNVSEEKILTEDKATSTNENMRFSKKILDDTLGADYRVVVITNNFHIYRSTMIAYDEGLKNVTHIHCGLQWYNFIPCYLRESLAVLKLWVIG